MVCSVEGDPTPSISWFRNSFPVNISDPRIRILSSGKFILFSSDLYTFFRFILFSSFSRSLQLYYFLQVYTIIFRFITILFRFILFSSGLYYLFKFIRFINFTRTLGLPPFLKCNHQHRQSNGAHLGLHIIVTVTVSKPTRANMHMEHPENYCLKTPQKIMLILNGFIVSGPYPSKIE